MTNRYGLRLRTHMGWKSGPHPGMHSCEANAYKWWLQFKVTELPDGGCLWYAEALPKYPWELGLRSTCGHIPATPDGSSAVEAAQSAAEQAGVDLLGAMAEELIIAVATCTKTHLVVRPRNEWD